MRVYVAGPYAIGDVLANVRAAVLAGDRLLSAGHTPYVPHLNHYWDAIVERPTADWLAFDTEWLAVCDALIRLPGESVGSDNEVVRAHLWGIKVWDGPDPVAAFLGER